MPITPAHERPYPTLIGAVNDTRMATIDVCGASIGSHAERMNDTGVAAKKTDTLISLESSGGRRSTKMRDSDDAIPPEALKYTDVDMTPWPLGWVGGSTPSALADSSSLVQPASIPKTMPAA